MPDRYEACGIESPEGVDLLGNQSSFRKTRLSSLAFATLMLFCGGTGLWDALRHDQPLLDSNRVWFALIYLTHWLMFVPHELAHAVTAKFLGYRQIRILVGSGKPLFCVKFFGFEWLFNRVP